VNGGDDGTRATGVDELSAKPSHVDIDRAGLHRVSASPQDGAEFLPSKEPAEDRCERRQELKLRRRQRKPPARHPRLSPFTTDVELPTRISFL